MQGGLLHLLGNDGAQGKVKAVYRVAVHAYELSSRSRSSARNEVFEQT